MISILGAGAIGLYLAAKFGRVGAVEVLPRRFEGFSAEGSVRVTGAEEFSGPARFAREISPTAAAAVVTVKAFDLEAALARLRGYRGPIYLAQNGLGILESARAFAPDLDLRRMIVVQGLRRTSPSSVANGGGRGVQLAAAERGSELVQILEKAGVGLEFFGTEALLEWQKAVWTIPTNSVCAVGGLTENAAVLDPERLGPAFELVFGECVLLARAEGVDFSQADQARFRALIQSVAQNRCSTVQDLEAGRRTENEFLSGAVVARARRAGIEVPGNLLIFRALEALEKARLRPEKD